MKILVNIIRVFVGLLFIFSGLIKANDPLGLGYKMQEYFEIWGVHQFNDWTLTMSVLMNAFEIIAGFALIIGARIRLFIWLLLLLIVFFTFLTGYTAFTGTPKNCGCFGDCLPITSQTSFLKDVVLTVLIAFLFWKQKYIQPFFSKKGTTIALLLITIFSFGFQWYTLNYLPVVDCLPFKKGNNIPDKTKMPANAIPDSTVITFVYKKGGKNVEFTADKFPADFSADKYQYVDRFDKIIRKGVNNEPPIKGLSLSGTTDVDSTDIVMAEPYAVLLFDEKFETPVADWQKEFGKLYAEMKKKHIPVYVVTTSLDMAAAKLASTPFKDVPVFKCDYTVIRMAARANPSLYLLKEGTVLDKWSFKRFDEASKKLDKLPMLPKPGDIAAPNADSMNVKTDTTNNQ